MSAQLAALLGGDLVDFVRDVASVGAMLALMVLAPRYLKTRDAQAQLAAKDQIIETDRQSVQSLRDRVDTLEVEIEECKEAARTAEKSALEWRTRYGEQSKYTAEGALLEVRDSIKRMEATTVTAIQALGEMVMKSNELLAGLHGSGGRRGVSGRGGPSGREGGEVSTST